MSVKMSVPFFLNQMAFLLVFFTCHFIFSVFFDFASVAKPSFCKSRVRRGTPKGGKMSLLFFSNEAAFFDAFLRAISFFQSLFQFCFRCKSSILQV